MKRPVVALAAVVAALMVAGGMGVAVNRSSSSSPAPTSTSVPATSSSTTAPAAPATPGPLDEVLPGLQAFVERERGLKFKGPVRTTVLEGPAFAERAVAAETADLEEAEETEAVLKAIGLLERDVDLKKAVERFVEASALGFYDSETDELVLRGSRVTPLVRITLVHELLHALEDQHFNLHREDLGDEAAVGFLALLEGSALRIEDRYRDSLPATERRDAEREEESLADQLPLDLPEVVEAAYGFPYQYGPDLVRALLREGGQARLDAAFADPPASSEQVLDPRRYLRGDRPKEVAVPKADGEPFDDGEVGALFLILMLDVELGTGRALEAAIGWGGDRYVAWRDGRRTCVRMEFVMDSPHHTTELEEALRDWADRRQGGATASGTTLTTCA
ncbi:MAG TPA: hypothetical protein VHE80_08890 [Acidimicrobiales bacterium]|nr:hypothetical protein [Acidimicrobiales bacterium]